MSVSKLFTPVLRTKRGNAGDATERTDMFVNVPLHPEVPVFTGPTDRGEPCYPLRLGADSQTSTKSVERHPYASSPQESTKY